MLDREGCIALNMVSGIGYMKFKALCEAFENPVNVFGATKEQLLNVNGIGEKIANSILDFSIDKTLKDELELVDRAGVRVITLYDQNYPECLRALYDPPLCLYVRGTLPEMPQNAIAIVGSRRMSSYGARVTKLIASEAVMANFSVVSGLALGIDTVAHTTAVELNGVTVAVLGGGLSRLHPQENLSLARKIIENNGALVSEFPMNFPVSRTSFPRRNRIVAGMCSTTIVIEAGVKSGAMITARLALENGRDVYAVPGLIDNPQAGGCNLLIKDGSAGLIESFADVLKGMELEHIPLKSSDELFESSVYNVEALDDLSNNERIVCDILDNFGELNLEEILEKSKLSVGDLLGVLMTLEMKFVIVQSAEKRYSKR